MPTRMRLLPHELSARILAAEEHAAAVDAHYVIPCLFRHLVDHAMVFRTANASVVDHTERRSISSYYPWSNMRCL